MSQPFTLYYRENCHLCDSMRQALVAFQKDKQADFHWVEIDIDRDTELIRLYDTRVPVLHYCGKDVCHHFYDENAILAIFKATNSS